VLLSNVTAFAPDEKLYLDIYQKTRASKVNLKEHIGWPTSNTFFLDVIYSPARFLSKIGLSDLDSIRIYSMILGYIAILYLYFFMISWTKENLKVTSNLKYLVYFYLIPTNILWTSLGLRESFLYLSISFSIIGVIKFQKNTKTSDLLVVIFGLVLLSYTKTYLAVILVASLMFSISLWYVLCRKVSLIPLRLLFVTLIPILIMISTPGAVAQLEFLRSHVISNSTEVRAQIETGINTESENTGSRTLNELAIQRTNNDKLSRLISSIVKPLESKSRIDKPKSILSSDDGSLNAFPDVILRDPVTIVRGVCYFLFSPNFFSSNVTTLLWLVGFESPLWLVLYILVIIGILRIRFSLQSESFGLLFSTTFISVYTLMSSVGETNIGTAIRHRSILILPILTLIFLLSENNRKFISFNKNELN